MDKRQKPERTRADGSGMFSPRSLATPRGSSPRFAKVHRSCAFAFLLLAVPVAALAAEAEASRTITLDVAGGGALGALCAAAVMWLNGQRKQRAERTPPLGEDVARTYVTKAEMQQCQGVCRRDIDGLRELIEEKDRSNEERIIGTHKRIDQVYKSLNKNNRSLGIIIGALFAQGKIPASVLAETEGD